MIDKDPSKSVRFIAKNIGVPEFLILNNIVVFGVVTSDADFIASFIVSLGLRFNTEADMNFLKEVVLFWIDKAAAGGPYLWQ